jgi:hypothetical protein
LKHRSVAHVKIEQRKVGAAYSRQQKSAVH